MDIRPEKNFSAVPGRTSENVNQQANRETGTGKLSGVAVAVEQTRQL